MKVWALTALVLAGCGPVRMDAVQKDQAGGQHLYTREDPDARAAARESTRDDECREVRQGRLTMALCPDPERLRAGVPAPLRFEAEENTASGTTPVTGALITVVLRHLGGRNAGLIHPEPVVSPVKESSPGHYEATAVFPAEGRWTVETAVMLSESEVVRLKFDVTVAPAAPAK